MEWVGLVSLVLVISFIGYPARIRKLEHKLAKIERKSKGENDMSKIINSLVGKQCKIKTEDGVWLSGNPEIRCTVLDADDEWMTISYTDKKEKTFTKIIRIESIDSVELAD